MGATLTGILFTDKTYQPDLTPSYALSDNSEKINLKYLKKLEPQEAKKMDEMKLLSDLQSEKQKLMSDNEKLLSEKDAAMKLLYLGLRNISSERGGESGTGTQGWKIALNTMCRLFPGRLPLC